MIIFHGGKLTVCFCCVSLLPEHHSMLPMIIAHINNLYNTCFWALVQQGEQTVSQAHETLRVRYFNPIRLTSLLSLHWQGTVSGQKNELLHSRFGINYNSLPERYRKGSVSLWDLELVSAIYQFTLEFYCSKDLSVRFLPTGTRRRLNPTTPSFTRPKKGRPQILIPWIHLGSLARRAWHRQPQKVKLQRNALC